MTFAQFLAQVRRQLEEATANTWADESILHWANQAALDIARKAKPLRDEQYTTATIGQQSYTAPTGTLTPIAVYWHDGGTRIKLGREDFDTLIGADDGTNGIPVAFAWDDDALYLRPAPSTEGTIRWFRYHAPAEMASTDSLPFNGAYDSAIEYFVLKRAFEQINDWQSADAYRDRYEQSLHDAIVQEQMEGSALLSAAPVEVY